MWNFRDVVVWRRSRILVGTVFAVTERFPKHHRHGLASQLQRAANSIGANIAEAGARSAGPDRARLLSYAIASANETEHHVIVATDVGLLDGDMGERLAREIDEIRLMTKALRMRTLELGI